MATEDVGKKDAVIIHPTGSIAIIRKCDYDLLLSDQKRVHGLRKLVSEQRETITELRAELDQLREQVGNA